jgi:hypothetical protein
MALGEAVNRNGRNGRNGADLLNARYICVTVLGFISPPIGGDITTETL